jgi:hypothetical protein
MHLSIRKRIPFLLLLLLLCLTFTGCGSETETSTAADSTPSILTSPEDIQLSTTDGSEYSFTYGTETFRAVHQENNWRIFHSYRITNRSDMILICRALITEHPIPDKAGTGYRTPEDLTDEWEQHNLAFTLLPEGAEWKESARHVDLNPEDQGKNILEFLNERLPE